MADLGWLLSLAATIAAPAAIGMAAADLQPSSIGVTMTPHLCDGGASAMDVRMTIAAPAFAAGEPIVRLPLTLVGIPSARYDGTALRASDDRGTLVLAQEEEPPTPQGVYRRWKADRASVGDVVVTYRAPPRAVSAATNNGPLFDLREQPCGLAGAGVGFVATPARPGPYRVTLHWDLSHAPAGSRGVWSLGQGDVTTVIPADVLAFSYYAAGRLVSYPARPGDAFGLYWFGTAPFDTAALGRQIEPLYRSMAAFFGDTRSSYRVFARQNPYRGLGGTSLAHSFMFGYNPDDKPTLDTMQGLIAHEMTHTWPAMQGEHGDTAWYSEGTAEYYSMLLSLRARAITPDQFLGSLNQKARDYYANPFIRLSNAEAARLFWSDATAQTVPYGRGLLYLVRTDARIRDASHGARSLDDVVRELYRREKAAQSYGIADWLALVGQEIGATAAKADYDAMATGTVMTPPANRFAPCFAAVERRIRPLALGFARKSLNDDRIVRGLDPGSNAAHAGVRDGDHVVAATEFEVIRRDPAATMTLTLDRGGQTSTVTFLPRGAETVGYEWVRTPGTSDTACVF